MSCEVLLRILFSIATVYNFTRNLFLKLLWVEPSARKTLQLYGKHSTLVQTVRIIRH